jgi:tRNA/tmRNA/rRNA uracil-C5-methylase (TrmA/RlmC/RlmD family)
VGERFDVEVGPVGHGGFCVARVAEEGGRVVFVRHAVPGERVVVELTEGTDGDRFWRGDAVLVLRASSDRVLAPCPVAGPGGCGGCDFQHVSLARQRALKADVVREQLRRLAGVELDLAAVEPVPGGADGLRWRTRMRYARTVDGRRGLRAHRSDLVVPVEDCLIAHPDARDSGSSGPTTVTEVVEVALGRHSFRVAADGFWQVHPGLPALLVDTVLGMLAPRDGERSLDLYAGVGLFARFLADAVGPRGRVLAVEGDRDAAGHAEHNLSEVPHAEVVCGPVRQVLSQGPRDAVDIVVLDPPREGARRPVVEEVVARSPRAAAYVACDPAALARDVAVFAEHGYALTGLRAFDGFPMTSHVEVVALLSKADEPWRTSW